MSDPTPTTGLLEQPELRPGPGTLLGPNGVVGLIRRVDTPPWRGWLLAGNGPADFDAGFQPFSQGLKVSRDGVKLFFDDGSGKPIESRILAKPMVNGVLHGGGLVFETAQDPDARLIQYWINNPAPTGSDEFSDPTFGFTPGPVCNSQ